MGAAVGAAGRSLVLSVKVINALPVLVTVLMSGLNVVTRLPDLAGDHRVSAAALLVMTMS